QPLPQVTVSQPKARPKQAAPRPKGQPAARPLPQPTTVATPTTTPATSTPGTPATTPLNTNTVTGVASTLGLTVFETPATVEVVDRQMMQDRGYQTNVEAAAGAVGVLAIDAAGAPANFMMRGFQFGQVN